MNFKEAQEAKNLVKFVTYVHENVDRAIDLRIILFKEEIYVSYDGQEYSIYTAESIDPNIYQAYVMVIKMSEVDNEIVQTYVSMNLLDMCQYLEDMLFEHIKTEAYFKDDIDYIDKKYGGLDPEVRI